MTLNKNIITVATIAAIAIGFLISLRFQTQKELDDAERMQQERLVGMESVVNALEEENRQLKEAQERITEELDKFTKEGINNPFLIAKLNKLKISDGTIAVKGPGIKMVIRDSGEGIQVVYPLNPDDLRRIINILRYAGAEVISINGQRVIANTSVVLSGDSTILINSVPISKIGGTAYEILATGDQDKLVDYLMKLDVTTDLEQDGMKVDITREFVEIPSYKGGYIYEYAEKLKA